MSSPTTLGDYREIAVALFGEDSEATVFLDRKIKAQGKDMKVLAAESQMIYLLMSLHFQTEET